MSDTILLAGDYNSDGVVGAADYLVWRNSVGELGSGLPADGNGNGQIDPGDYEIWKNNFGLTTGNGAGRGARVTVPEPASALLLILAMSIWLLRRAAMNLSFATGR